ncbi:unnamed protein product [Thelazia callipaeda]|uniref:SH2 domain-containing protein n=1 Tax=Thelazia callipaeda TaxID=103827 RepID=A0A0N5CZ65_THECL|nr:unnamed protein product [Thelazia callipaeda]
MEESFNLILVEIFIDVSSTVMTRGSAERSSLTFFLPCSLFILATDCVENDEPSRVRISESNRNEETTNFGVNMSKKREGPAIANAQIHSIAKTEYANEIVPMKALIDKFGYEKCSNSPMIDMLQSSTTKDHPRPPPDFRSGINRMKKSKAVQCDKRATSSKDKVRSKLVEAPSICEDKEHKRTKYGDKKITLLEQIIRTHPIWYLQHIGRSAASHLLRPMNRGAFIVRSSSKPNAMALSIRSPSGLSSDIDHYLIESAGLDKSVRVESSPYFFKSLPLLIEHYCLHGEELQTNLVLPVAITNCCTSMQLQSLALMGQG